MASSDRAFRALVRFEPDVALGLIGVLAPGLLPRDARLVAEAVDDPHLEAPPPPLDADWIARLDPDELLHMECQGYRDTTFPSRLFRYHLSLVLRYRERRVRTVALWTAPAPAQQRRPVIEVGDVTVRVTVLELHAASAEALLEDPRSACFAPGAHAGEMTADELCARTAKVLAETRAGWRRRHMAVVAAIGRQRYKEMVKAMDDANLEPIVIEDLVKYGQDLGLEAGREEGLTYARASLLEVFDARGLVLDSDQREHIEGESSLERLALWLRRALTATSAREALADDR